MPKLIQEMAAYFAANGSLSDAANFSQLVLAGAWGELRHLASIIGL